MKTSLKKILITFLFFLAKITYSMTANNNQELFSAVSQGDLLTTQKLVNKDNIHAQDKNGNTPLSIAALEGHKDIVKFLVKNKANIEHKNINGDSALLIAIQGNRQKIVHLLLFDNSEQRRICRSMVTVIPDFYA